MNHYDLYIDSIRRRKVKVESYLVGSGSGLLFECIGPDISGRQIRILFFFSRVGSGSESTQPGTAALVITMTVKQNKRFLITNRKGTEMLLLFSELHCPPQKADDPALDPYFE